ncbi:MAG: 30S ribosomal protein S6 [Candidatus Omnitrophica bacterium]|nr:30S ribosomal protein S6 [Candidatus Omnitrophota bacterium]
MSSLNRDYEGILIVHPESGEAQIGKLQAQFAELVSHHRGRILETTPLGKRRLTTKIKKLSEGIYLQIRFQLPPSEVEGLRKSSGMMETVLRFFTVQESRSKAVGSKEEKANGESQ